MKHSAHIFSDRNLNPVQLDEWLTAHQSEPLVDLPAGGAAGLGAAGVAGVGRAVLPVWLAGVAGAAGVSVVLVAGDDCALDVL